MPLSRILIVSAVLALGFTPSASAGIFSRKAKPAPARVPELLIQLKSGADESQREDAAEELRQFDPKSHPEIVGSLIEALGKDGGAGVRAEAAASLGKLRPINQQIGYASNRLRTMTAPYASGSRRGRLCFSITWSAIVAAVRPMHRRRTERSRCRRRNQRLAHWVW